MAGTKPEAPSDAWNPNVGDVLEGTVADVDAGWSDYANAFYPIVKVAEKDTGEVRTVHAFHQKLAERLKLLRPKRGEKIRISFDGTTATKDGKRTVSLYTVDQPDKDVIGMVWDAIDPRQPADRPAGPGPGDDHPF